MQSVAATRRITGSLVQRFLWRDDYFRLPGCPVSLRSSFGNVVEATPIASKQHVMPLSAVTADGWTAHVGRVVSRAAFGVFVDFGCERLGLLPLRGTNATSKDTLDALVLGEPLSVYIASRNLDTGKINLSLEPVMKPRIRMSAVIADGRTRYEAQVANVASFGIFVDIGTELLALLPYSGSRNEGAIGLSVGDHVGVYVIEKRKDTGRLVCTLEPAAVPRQRCIDIVADGQTPYNGLVDAVCSKVGAFVDIGYDAKVVLPLRRTIVAPADARVAALQPGEEVTVYITTTSPQGKVSVSLTPTAAPLLPLASVVADGQTVYPGIVVGKAEFGAFVDINCSHQALLPVHDVADIAAWDEIQVGSHLSVYVLSKSKDTGKMSVSLRRTERPRLPWDAIVCDGQTPYDGTVISKSWYGVFIDICCECHGRLVIREGQAGTDERLAKLRPGDIVTTYVVEKQPDIGKVKLSLDPRDRALIQCRDLVVDGQTPYEGIVSHISSLGAIVDIGCERAGLLPRQDPTGMFVRSPDSIDHLAVGSPVRTFVCRRNPAKGRLTLALEASTQPRLSLADIFCDPAAQYTGVVYNLNYTTAMLEFGCEVSGALPRDEAHPRLAVGDVLLVRPTEFDQESGRAILTRARPPPPPPPR